MIRNALAIDLANKIAAALEGRIAKASDADSAFADLARARRLLGNGQITQLQFKACLQSAIVNDNLPGDAKAPLEDELKTFANQKPLVIEGELDSRQSVYASQQVLVPRSAIVPGGSEAWTPIHPKESEGLFAQISPIDSALTVTPAGTVCEKRTLPWYDNAILLRIYDDRWAMPDLVVYYLVHDDNIYRLDGTSPKIHEVNKKAPIKVTEDNVLDYLRFFCFFVRGEEGPFYVLENSDDPFVKAMVISNTVRSVIEGAAAPAEYVGKTDKGHFACDVTVYYANALFKAKMEVHPTGMIEMLDDEPVAADLPARIKAPLTYSRK